MYYQLVSGRLAFLLWFIIYLLLTRIKACLAARSRRRRRLRGLLRLAATQILQELQLADQQLDLMIELSQHHPVESLDEVAISTLPHVQATRESTCCICLDGVDKGQVTTDLPCSHIFHSTCVDAWLLQRPVCPVCRARVVVDYDSASSVDIL